MLDRLTIFILALAALMLLTGCAQYRAMPINPNAVERSLSPPNVAELRIQAGQIKHPILRPLSFDLQDGLSPDEAAVLAVLLNPSLRTIRDGRGIAEAQLLQAGLLPNPQLSYSLDVPVGGDTAGAVNAFGVGLSWDVTSLIRRPAKVSQAEARRTAVDLDIAWREWQTGQAAKMAVYRLACLQRQIALAEQSDRFGAQQSALIRKAVARGWRTATDLAVAEAASRQTSQRLLNRKRQAGQQRLKLKRLLGLPAEARIHLADDIQLPPRFEAPGAKELLGGLEKRRLDLLALRRGYDSREAAVRAAILGQFPRISIGPTIGRDTDTVETAGFALAIELPLFDRNQGRIAVERATRQRLFDEYTDRVFQARSDIEMILTRIRFLNRLIAAAQAAEADFQKLVNLYSGALAAGRADALSTYAARDQLADSRLKEIALKGQLAEAVIALELAAGMYRVPQPPRTHTAAPAGGQEVSP